MNKILIGLLFILIASIGISTITASPDADNLDVDKPWAYLPMNPVSIPVYVDFPLVSDSADLSVAGDPINIDSDDVVGLFTANNLVCMASDDVPDPGWGNNPGQGLDGPTKDPKIPYMPSLDPNHPYNPFNPFNPSGPINQ